MNSNIKPEDRALNRKLSAAKTPKTPRARAPKPKRVSLSNENKETKRNKILNNSAKRKISSDYSSSDDDKVNVFVCLIRREGSYLYIDNWTNCLNYALYTSKNDETFPSLYQVIFAC